MPTLSLMRLRLPPSCAGPCPGVVGPPRVLKKEGATADTKDCSVLLATLTRLADRVALLARSPLSCGTLHCRTPAHQKLHKTCPVDRSSQILVAICCSPGGTAKSQAPQLRPLHSHSTRITRVVLPVTDCTGSLQVPSCKSIDCCATN